MDYSHPWSHRLLKTRVESLADTLSVQYAALMSTNMEKYSDRNDTKKYPLMESSSMRHVLSFSSLILTASNACFNCSRCLYYHVDWLRSAPDVGQDGDLPEHHRCPIILSLVSLPLWNEGYEAAGLLCHEELVLEHVYPVPLMIGEAAQYPPVTVHEAGDQPQAVIDQSELRLRGTINSISDDISEPVSLRWAVEMFSQWR